MFLLPSSAPKLRRVAELLLHRQVSAVRRIEGPAVDHGEGRALRRPRERVPDSEIAGARARGSALESRHLAPDIWCARVDAYSEGDREHASIQAPSYEDIQDKFFARG